MRRNRGKRGGCRRANSAPAAPESAPAAARSARFPGGFACGSYPWTPRTAPAAPPAGRGRPAGAAAAGAEAGAVLPHHGRTGACAARKKTIAQKPDPPCTPNGAGCLCATRSVAMWSHLRLIEVAPYERLNMVMLGRLYNRRKKAAGGRADRDLSGGQNDTPKTADVPAAEAGRFQTYSVLYMCWCRYSSSTGT